MKPVVEARRREPLVDAKGESERWKNAGSRGPAGRRRARSGTGWQVGARVVSRLQKSERRIFLSAEVDVTVKAGAEAEAGGSSASAVGL
jgi:hypothetical protein